MDVIDFKENEDGSATVTLNMTEEEQKFLLEYAIKKILEEEINKDEH